MRYLVLSILIGFSANIFAEVKMNDQCGKQSEVAKESRLYNNIKWKTASEQDNFGYDIYRANTEDGEYSIINEDTIEGAGTTDSATAYEFHDDTIDPCKQYYYYIESISMDGVREAFTPKFQSKLKLQPKK
ncbi:hypothetical protein MNBD_GAMMA01-78 [hydrothermal vent metagenome]|uniref:Uncharacterized protein n=1 Tax=hydrothermal vent metagenome TaxID=652676 RepID=A0A3B0VH90_9ZZZZ